MTNLVFVTRAYVGNQVNFNAWMQGLAIKGSGPYTSGNWLYNNVLSLTVLAIANCN